uniref:Uncharacterized protein n=1 Tax=Rhizophora mucronata TaxID=61149 RepID=A0A2P2MXZ1_RHIMU
MVGKKSLSPPKELKQVAKRMLWQASSREMPSLSASSSTGPAAE